jgi:membrane fusion protein (multidrug efflux system)
VVLVADVIQRDIPVLVEYVGVLDGSVNVTILAEVKGYLEAQPYQEGSFVKVGDLLFQIDPRPFQATVARAQGELAAARARQVRAEIDVRRFTPLAAESVISQQDLDHAVQENLAALAQVAAAEAALEEARIQLGFTRITAPTDGIAGQATARIGDLVGEGAVLTTVSQVNPIRAYLPLSEQRYLLVSDRIRAAEALPFDERPERFELILADGSAYPHKGKFSFMDRSVDPRTGTIRIVVLFPNEGNVLRPGQFVRVRYLPTIKTGACLIPQRAVSELQGRYEVAVVDSSNTVAMRPVKPAERVGPLWVIDEGLRPGERVVAEGLQKVRSGTVVEAKPFAVSLPEPLPPALTLQLEGR